MSTSRQVEQALELALSLSFDLEQAKPHEIRHLQVVISQIQENLKPFLIEESVNKVPKPKGHPVDTLLKKGKVTLIEGRYKQLVQIYDELMIVMGSVAMPPKGLKFLSAKQNDSLTWFPLDLNGDKSAALYLMAEWEIAPINPKANGVLSGEWEGFDLDQAMEDSGFDQDDY